MAVVARKRQHGTTLYVVTEWRGKKHWERAGSDKRVARRLSDQRKREVADGTFTPHARTGRATVAEFAEKWLDGRRCRWAEDEAGYVRRHVLSREWFASLAIEDVRGHHVRQLVDELHATKSERTGRLLSGKTVSTIYGIGSTMFAAAERAEIILRNPFNLERGVLQHKSAVRRTPYTVYEVRRIMTCAEMRPTARVFAAVAFLTGMREGEICGLRWSDWTEAPALTCLNVSKQYDGAPLKSDKHQAGEHARKVPVHPELAKVIGWWRTEGFPLVYMRAPEPNDPIVPDSRFQVFDRSAAYSMWRDALVKAGVANRTLHSTRHTFITMCRRGGARVDVLERITHNARGAIIDEYTHWEWAPLCEAVLSLRLDSEAPTVSSEPARMVGDAVGAALANGSRLLVAPPGVEPGRPNVTCGNSTYDPRRFPNTLADGDREMPVKSGDDPAARHRPDASVTRDTEIAARTRRGVDLATSGREAESDENLAELARLVSGGAA